MRKCWGILLSIGVIMLFIVTQEDFLDLFLSFLQSFITNIKQVETSMGTVIAIIGFCMVFKSKVIDNRFNKKLQLLFGQELFKQMEIVILKLLKSGMNPDQLIAKIRLIDPTEISMRGAIKELQDSLKLNKVIAPLKMTKEHAKQLDQECKALWEEIAKKITQYYMERSLLKSNPTKESFKPKTKYIKADEIIREMGKKVVLDHLQPK